MPVDTGKVTGRRSPHFNKLEEILAEAERLAKVPIHPLGNWTPGQIFRHLATAMNRSINGFPYRMSWPFRLLGWLMKRRVLSRGMPAGYQLDSRAADAIVPPPTETNEGLEQLRRAIPRLRTESTRHPHPFFGSLANDDWEQLHCRLAELHLSFLLPEK